MSFSNASLSLSSAETALQAGSVSWRDWVEHEGEAQAVLALEGRLDFFHWRVVATELGAAQMSLAMVERLLEEGSGAFALMLAERRELAPEAHARLALWAAETIEGGWARQAAEGALAASVAPGIGLVVQRLLQNGRTPEAERNRLLDALQTRGKRALGAYLVNPELLRSARPAPADWLLQVARDLRGRESPLVATLVSHPSADASVWVAVIRSRIHRETLQEVLLAHSHVLAERTVRQALLAHPIATARFTRTLLPFCEDDEVLAHLRALLRRDPEGSVALLGSLSPGRLRGLQAEDLAPLLSHAAAEVRLGVIALLGRLEAEARSEEEREESLCRRRSR